MRADVARPVGTRSPAPLRVVLVDMDDTLFDHSHSLREGLASVRRSDSVLRSHPLATVVTEYERLLEEIHPEVLGGRLTHTEARVERFRRLLDWAGPPSAGRDLAGLSDRYRAAYQSARRPVDGAPELLRAIHGRVPVGVVTNNHTAEQLDKIAAIGIGPSIDFLLTSEEVGFAKPEAEIFRAALRRAGAEPTNAVMLGDSWTADVAGAAAVGIRPVWLNRRGVPRPDRRLPVSELRSLQPAARALGILLGGEAADGPG